MTRKLYALLVGINQYAEKPLHGCVNDIEAVEQFLENRLDFNPGDRHIEKLLNSEATRQAVINKFENHLCQAGKDDTVLFYFCGHGSQELAAPEFRTLAGDEEGDERTFETIVCYDSRSRQEDGTDIRDLADKEVRYLIAKVAKNEPHILVVYDCCHSSSGTRENNVQETTRQAPADWRPARKYDEFYFAQDSQVAQALKQGKFPEGNHVFISGCLYSETAKEVDVDGEIRGAFSYFLVQELNRLNAALSYKDLIREVSGRVRGYRRDQTPQIEAIGLSAETLDSMVFLGSRDAIKPREPYFDLIHRPKIEKQVAEWIITGGASDFVQLGAELDVYPENSTAEGISQEVGKIGSVRTTDVRVDESIVDVSEVQLPYASYRAVLKKQPLPAVNFYVEGDEVAIAQVEQKFLNSPIVEIVRDRKKQHEYRLYAKDQTFEIRDASDRLLVVPIEGTSDYNVSAAVKQVEHIARWQKARQLDNPHAKLSKDAIEISITYDGKIYTDSDLQLEHQATIQIKLKNKSKRSLYYTILDIASDYSVGIFKIFPVKNDQLWVRLAPDEEYLGEALMNGELIKDIPFGMPEEVVDKGLTAYEDVLKLLASTEPFTTATLQSFEQAGLSLASLAERQMLASSPLVGDWVTKQVTLTTVRTTSVALDSQPKEISPGVWATAPSRLAAKIRFNPPSSISRSLSSDTLPALLNDTQAFQFSTSRDMAQETSALELTVDSSTLDAVTPESPLKLSVDRLLEENERVLVLAQDDQFYFPVGLGQSKGGKTEIKIERLYNPQAVGAGDRELSQAIQLCFRKVTLDKLGRKSSYAWLRVASLQPNGTVRYTDEKDVDSVIAAVAKANRIVLYIHGIIGDTESMIPSVRYAKVNADGQSMPLEDVYDLVLAFDYESLNTPIDQTARELKQLLSEVGLTPDHGKTLHILAHSMGGLVSRSFIEQYGGDEVVSHLIMVGTPNGGSPWATVYDLATTLLLFSLNLSAVPVAPSLLEKMIEAMSVTVQEMHVTKSSFLSELNQAAGDPGCPYSIIAGSTALIDRDLKAKQLLATAKKQMRQAIELPFGDEDNDIAVAVSSITDVPTHRTSAVRILDPIACDHLSYFRHPEGLRAIADAIEHAI